MPKKVHHTHRTHICIHKASLHNLKELSVNIPRHALTVVTGVSGSGKSSLVFDTLFVEGQRRYVESISTYVRQFLGRMQKPPVGWIKGISPAVAIQQKGRSYNPRSTVGTMTEVYDYLRLLYARVGKTYAPENGKIVKRETPRDVLSYIEQLAVGTRYQVAALLSPKEDLSFVEFLRVTLQKGYTRLLTEKEEVLFIEDIAPSSYQQLSSTPLALLIDRGVVEESISQSQKDRLLESIQTAFHEGKGRCFIQYNRERRFFSEHFEHNGLRFMEPSVHMFSFNSPQGACPRCEGFGRTIGMDSSKVIPDPSLSLYEGAIAPWRTTSNKKWLEPLLMNQDLLHFPIHRAYRELSEKEQAVVWNGSGEFQGIHAFFAYISSKKHKIQYRVMASRYQGKVPCPDCKGSRLRKEATYVHIGGKSIGEVLAQPIEELVNFFAQLEFDKGDQKVASFLLSELRDRLNYLLKVGLGYLTLSRLSATLSGGEYQRIQLATALGRPLVGAMYILDEPTIGLHPRDIDQLVSVLEALRDKGNPVIVVEHEERVMRAADQLLDIGPGAGSEGGRLVFQGTYDQLSQSKGSATADYLLGSRSIPIPQRRRPVVHCLRLEGLSMHNLKHMSVDIPLGVMTVLTGVSGSGKSTLVQQALFPALAYELGLSGGLQARGYKLKGEYQRVRSLQLIDQQPMGRSSRSNPVTYIKAYDMIRQLFAQTAQARRKGLTASHFSFNTSGGRCETCAGEGEVRIEMQFLADVQLTCEACEGRRFSPSVLDVSYREKHIDDVLGMSVVEAVDFFKDQALLAEKLEVLLRVGLGYMHLGQPSSALSGGEAQRLKLASFLLKKSEQHTLFIFDEPTTGLHMQDTQLLLGALQALVEMGHSVLVVEHNLDVIKCADWVIDLGPEAGDQGGELCFEGTPELLCQQKNNHTAHYLKEKMHNLPHA